MKVSELTGAQLDYWVARADREGIRWERHDNDWIGFGKIGSSPEFICWVITNKSTLRDRSALQDKFLGARFYEPSKNWTQGGPLLDEVAQEALHVCKGRWMVSSWKNCHNYGPTLLIAAMRAYVASKFGDEVPDEIAQQ